MGGEVRGEGKGGERKGREGMVGRGGARPPRILGLEPPLLDIITN